MAENIARQLERRVNFRRATKMTAQNTMSAGAKGIRIEVAGRLNGAEMARKEMYKEGRTPLHTFRADIDYCQTEALTKVGLLGIKVWICRGEVYGKKDLMPNYTQQSERGGRNYGDNNRGKGDKDGKPRRRRNNNNR